MEITGKIKAIGATKEVSESFKSRELVISTDDQYVQHISIQFVQDKCDLLDKFKVGQNVTVGINIRGREWTSPQGEIKYFNTIQGWKINADVNNVPVNNAEVVSQSPSPEGDIPF